jgi:hypothetical protein
MKRLVGTLVGVISLGLGLAALTPPAYGHGGDTSLIHACVKKSNGALRIIAPSGTCKKIETALDWNVSGPAPLAVYDANGNMVGPVTWASGENTNFVGVAFTVGTRRFSLLVLSDEFQGNTNQVLFFESSDCSGPAFMDDPGPSPLLPGVIVGNDTIYIQDGAARSVATKSNLGILTPNSTCNGGPTYNGGNPDIREVVPALLLIDNLYTQFPPPFSVR